MGILKRCSIPLVVFFIAIILAFWIFNVQGSYEPEFLLPILNTLFIGILPIIVSLLAAKAYLDKNLLSALFMCCGMLIFGLGSILAGWLRYAPGGANFTVTIHNSAVLLASIFNLTAASFGENPLAKAESRKRMKTRIILCMFGVCCVTAAITIATVKAWMPPFFDANGATIIRQTVLWLAIVFDFASCSVFATHYKRNPHEPLYWYIMSLCMITIGLFAVCAQEEVGSAVCWVGRIAQYIGGFCALYSLLGFTKDKVFDISDIIADFFVDAEASYKNLMETSNDAIISVDQNLKMFFINSAATRLFGYKEPELLGQSFSELLITEPYLELLRFIDDETILQDTPPRSMQLEARKKNGSLFPIEVSVSVRKLRADRVSTFIIRDITRRKQNEERINRQRTVLQTINQIHECSIKCDNVKELSKACLAIAEYTTRSKFGFIGIVGEDEMFHILATGKPDWLQDNTEQAYGLETNQVFLKILQTGKSYISNVPISYPGRNTAGIHPEIRTFLGVPLMRNGKVFGIMGLGNRDDGYRNEDAELIEILAPTILEVLLHMRSEQRFRDSEQRFNAFMEAIPCMAWMKDEQGRRVFLNKEWENVFNRKKEYGLGKTEYELYPNKIAEDMRKADLEVIKTGKYVVKQEEIVRSGRELRIIQSIRFPFKNTSGEVFTGGIALDITEWKKAEDSLRQSQMLLQAIIEGTADIVFLKNRQGNWLMCNSALQTVTGKTKAEMIGKNDYEIFGDAKTALKFTENDTRIMENDKAEVLEECLHTKFEERIYLSSKSPWHDSEGKVIGIIGIARDITDRIQMEKELQRTAEELEHKNKLITDFFINLSHEFRTPLSIIMLALEMIEQDIAQKELNMESIVGNTSVMRQNSLRLYRLVTNLLDVTKIDGGFVKPVLEDVNIVSTLARLVNSIQPYALKKGLALSFSSNVKLKLMSTDCRMLEKIMLNLISNAIKYTPKGGFIKVRLKNVSDTVCISVKDNGEGIPPDKVSIIFDRFRQANSSLTRSCEGCGIGLSITKALVEELDGRIWFKSAPGIGSEFFIELPAVKMDIARRSIEQDGMCMEKRIEMEFSDINFVC